MKDGTIKKIIVKHVTGCQNTIIWKKYVFQLTHCCWNLLSVFGVEVPTTVGTMDAPLWVMTLCSIVNVHHCLWGIRYFHFKTWRFHQKLPPIYKCKWSYIPEEYSLFWFAVIPNGSDPKIVAESELLTFLQGFK
jgi:hypothetical protein